MSPLTINELSEVIRKIRTVSSSLIQGKIYKHFIQQRVKVKMSPNSPSFLEIKG